MDKAPQISFRVIRNEDREFLFRIYAATREWEFQYALWPDDEKDAFLRSQFALQDQHYQSAFPNAAFRIIVLDGADIGRLYVDRRDDELRIIELALLPACRGRGIGSGILKALMQEAENGRVPVRLYVEHGNPAVRLYRRVGFCRLRSEGAHDFMEWRPARCRSAPVFAGIS